MFPINPLSNKSNRLIFVPQILNQIIKRKKMEEKDLLTAYKAPRAKVIELNVQGILCQSGGTEEFGIGSNSYDDDDWD